jgi:hypothetical protein
MNPSNEDIIAGLERDISTAKGRTDFLDRPDLVKRVTTLQSEVLRLRGEPTLHSLIG